MKYLIILLSLIGCHTDEARKEAKAFVTDKYGVIVRAAHCTNKSDAAYRYECVVFTETNHEVKLACSPHGCVEVEKPRMIVPLDVSMFAEKEGPRLGESEWCSGCQMAVILNEGMYRL